MSDADKKLIDNGVISLRLAVAGAWATAIAGFTVAMYLAHISAQLDRFATFQKSGWTIQMQSDYSRQMAWKNPQILVPDPVQIHNEHQN